MAEPARQEPLSVESEAPAPRRRRRRRRRSRSSKAAQKTHRRLRWLYFGLATLWGFIVGTAAILTGLNLVGRPVQVDPTILAILLAAGIVAVVGGLVAAAAYRDVIQRFR